MDYYFEFPDDVHHAREKFQTDNMAKHFYPTNAPEEMTPCHCHGDGNCFPRAISKLLFGTEEYYLTIHATLVYEAVIHKNYYLDNTYLQIGGTNDNNLKSLYSIYSEAYK